VKSYHYAGEGKWVGVSAYTIVDDTFMRSDAYLLVHDLLLIAHHFDHLFLYFLLLFFFLCFLFPFLLLLFLLLAPTLRLLSLLLLL
jgi:hypothetical protein